MRVKVKDFRPYEGKNQRKVRIGIKVKHFYFLCNRRLVQKMLTARMIETKCAKEMLDDMHKRKIDMAD